MAKEIIEFTIAQAFADEGEYEISLDNNLVKINLKLIQNDPSFENVAGMKAHTSGSGRVSFSSDPFGIANVTKVIIEFPYIINIPSDEINPKKQVLEIKQECIKYVNRLIEIVRIHTRKYWLRHISDQDILGFCRTQIHNDGSSQMMTGMDFGSGLQFPIQVLEQKQVHEKILKSLKNNERIPHANNLLLDAINYYHTRRFNTAVAIMYIGLEMGVADYLVYKLVQKEIPEEEIKKIMGKILSSRISKILDKHLKEFTGKSLKENDELWKKFEDIRNIRKSVVHPYPKILKQQETYDTLTGIQSILAWLYQN